MGAGAQPPGALLSPKPDAQHLRAHRGPHALLFPRSSDTKPPNPPPSPSPTPAAWPPGRTGRGPGHGWGGGALRLTHPPRGLDAQGGWAVPLARPGSGLALPRSGSLPAHTPAGPALHSHSRPCPSVFQSSQPGSQVGPRCHPPFDKITSAEPDPRSLEIPSLKSEVQEFSLIQLEVQT